MGDQASKTWFETAADQLASQKKRHVISTGITPSGPIHVGHLREVVTAHAVYLALLERQADVEFHYFMDNQDPLRKVYPFLDESRYLEHVGKPIGKIPPPQQGAAKTYADYYAEPFLESLRQLGMTPAVIRSDEIYKTDAFVEVVCQALEKKKLIAEIISDSTGKQLDSDWWPYQPICPKTGSMTATRVVGFDLDKKTVDYVSESGERGTVPIRGGGKLTWRVDWPARWKVLGVTMEPFGKDHSTRGGSYDTGKVICREIFNHEPPFPLEYEWISLKGLGDMSSSKGNVVTIHEMLEVVPAEVLRYFILRSKTTKRLTFDPALPLLNLVDEFDSKSEAASSTVRFSVVDDNTSLGVPFKHLITILQICGDDATVVAERLKQTGYEVKDQGVLAKRLQFARRWLDKYAPEEVKFSLQQTKPALVDELTQEQKEALKLVGDRLSADMDGDAVHKLVYEVKEELQLQPAQIFEAIYSALLGKKRGPRVGMFLAALDTKWVKQRFTEV